MPFKYCEQRHDFKWFLSRRAQAVYFLFGKTKMYLTYTSVKEHLTGEEKNTHLIGKLIGYLVTDFIKPTITTSD
jgi:hypothetical protein